MGKKLQSDVKRNHSRFSLMFCSVWFHKTLTNISFIARSCLYQQSGVVLFYNFVNCNESWCLIYLFLETHLNVSSNHFFLLFYQVILIHTSLTTGIKSDSISKCVSSVCTTEIFSLQLNRSLSCDGTYGNTKIPTIMSLLARWTCASPCSWMQLS